MKYTSSTETEDLQLAPDQWKTYRLIKLGRVESESGIVPVRRF